MTTAAVIGTICVVGGTAFVALGRARGSRYATALGLTFAALVAVIVFVARVRTGAARHAALQPGGFLLFGFYAPLWLIGLVPTWAMSRAREYYADRGSAQLTGAPEQLMSALAELGGKTATRDLRGVAVRALCIVRPGRRRWYDLSFSHPSVDRRIAQLERLARRLAQPRSAGYSAR